MPRMRAVRPLNGAGLPEQSRAALEALERLHERRAAGIYALLGVHLPPSYLREAILRLLMTEYANGTAHPISFYQRAVIAIASSSTTREEIYRLEALGVLLLIQEKTDKRRRIVTPSAHAIAWFASDFPRFFSEYAEIVQTATNGKP